MTQHISDEQVQKVYEACAEYPAAYIDSYVLEVIAIIDRMRAAEGELKVALRAVDMARLSTPYTPHSVEFYMGRAKAALIADKMEAQR